MIPSQCTASLQTAGKMSCGSVFHTATRLPCLTAKSVLGARGIIGVARFPSRGLRTTKVVVRVAQGQEVSTSPTSGTFASVEEVWTDEAKERYENLKARFMLADVDGNGVIDKKELKVMLESLDAGKENILESWLSDDDVDKVMAQYDANRNGVIDFEEFCNLAHDGILLEGKLAEYEAAFKAVDSGGNGKISATELTELMENLGHKLTYEKLIKVMKEYDVDHTGQIEFWEFMRMFRGQLLDLKEILEYIKLNPNQEEAEQASISHDTIERQPGEVTLIYSSSELDQHLAQPEDLTVVLASLTWCRPCKMLTKPLTTMAHHYPNVRFLKFYGNTNEDTKDLFKNRFKCRVTPTFYFFRNGEMIHSHTGANSGKLENHLRTQMEALGFTLPPSLNLDQKKGAPTM